MLNLRTSGGDVAESVPYMHSGANSQQRFRHEHDTETYLGNLGADLVDVDADAAARKEAVKLAKFGRRVRAREQDEGYELRKLEAYAK